jgi:hypothetical protein
VDEELGKRKVIILEDEDKLRWGRENCGEFNLKETQFYITD